MDASKDERGDGEYQANDKELEDDDSDLLKEVLVATLVIWEIVPVLVAEKIAIHAIAVVGVATLGDVRLEVLLVFFVELFLDLFIVAEVLTTFATSTKTNEQALEGDTTSTEENVGIKFRQLNRDIIHRHL